MLAAAMLVAVIGMAGCGDEPDFSPKALPSGVVRIDKGDNAIQVLGSRWKRGLIHNSIVGRVRNNTTDMTYHGLMIHVVILNQDGRIVDMKADKIDSLAPGEIWRFQADLKPFLLEKGLRYEIIGFDFRT